MANTEKDKKTDFGKLLEQVAVRDTGISRARGGYSIPAELVEAMLKKIREIKGAIFLPKEWLEEQLGLDIAKPIKGRPNSIKRKLNVNYGSLLDENEIWHVGKRSASANRPEGYSIGILKTSKEDAASWKKGER